MAPRWLSVKETAERCGVEPPTIYKWNREKRGPPSFRIGALLRFNPDEVDRWIAKQRERE